MDEVVWTLSFFFWKVAASRTPLTTMACPFISPGPMFYWEEIGTENPFESSPDQQWCRAV
jgi:hypothetical protein